MDILSKWCLVNIKQGLDRVEIITRPLLSCVIYISSIVYYVLSFKFCSINPYDFLLLILYLN